MSKESKNRKPVMMNLVEVPESQRFAVFSGYYLDTNPIGEMCRKPVTFYYDRKTKLYTFLFSDGGYHEFHSTGFRPSFPNRFDHWVDHNDHLLKGDPETGAEAEPFDKWELMSPNECLERMIKDAVSIKESAHWKIEQADEYEGLALEFFDTAYKLEVADITITQPELVSPVANLPDCYKSREDWMNHQCWLENGGFEDEDAPDGMSEADWEKYFSKDYKRYHTKKMTIQFVTDTESFVETISLPDGNLIYKRFVVEFPDAVCIWAEAWAGNDAVIKFDNLLQQEWINEQVEKYENE